MILRHAYVEDAEECWKVRNSAIRHGCKDSYTADEIKAWTPDDMPTVCLNVIKANPYFLIEGPEKKPVATGFLDISAGTVEAIFTLPEFTGQGLATRILEAIIGEARSRGFKSLALSATPNARSFYEKHGFIFIEETFTRSGIAKRKLRGIDMVTYLNDDTSGQVR